MGILNRVGTLGLTGKEARVEDEIYIVNVHLTKSGNLKVSASLNQNPSKPMKMSQLAQSKVGLRPQQADMKGRVAVRNFLQKFATVKIFR